MGLSTVALTPDDLQPHPHDEGPDDDSEPPAAANRLTPPDNLRLNLTGRGAMATARIPAVSAVPLRSFATSNQDLLEAFIRYLEIRNYATRTRYAYRKLLGKFLRFIGSQSILEAEQSTVRHFFAELRAKGASPRTIHNHRGTLRKFYRFLIVAEKFDRLSPAQFVGIPKMAPRRLPRCLSEDEIERLISAADCTRDRAVIELAYASGLRLAELANLRIEDIHFRAGTLMVRGGKGNKDRLAMIGSKASDAVRSYIGARRRGLVFLNLHGNALRRHGISKIVRETGQRVGMAVHAHALRHSFATHLMNHGADIRYVQELLGHANVGTTQIYTHAAIADLKAVHEKFHPRGRGDSHEKP